MKIFFWGAGKVGRRVLNVANSLEMLPDGFIDMNDDLQGRYIDNVEVFAPEVLQKNIDCVILITCIKCESINKFVVSMGVPAENIYHASNNNYELTLWLLEMRSKAISSRQFICDDLNYILFALQNGWVLGGVESWGYDMACMLRHNAYDAKLWVSVSQLIRKPYPPNEMLEILPDSNENDFLKDFIFKVNCLSTYLPFVFVSNFIGDNFYAACVCKIKFPDKIKLIAIIHNDEHLYYDEYTRMEGCISTCFYISSKMRNEMLKRGFPERKLQYLPWKINVDHGIKHNYSDVNMPIKLGYAGRMTKSQKRVDMFLYLLKRLDELNVDFRCDFAGEGDYLEDFEQEVLKLELQDKISCLGLLSKEDIYGFWQEHDIYLSCSEWEGHSISQVEAMANGAVPVVTDVSGARDDVHDGENGFVVAVGDMEVMAHRIKYLYEHRDILSCMGRRAVSDMRKKYSQVDIMKIWREVL